MIALPRSNRGAPLDSELQRTIDQFFTPRRAPLSARDELLLSQGEPLTLLDGEVLATTWGKGPTVLLAHGWESRRTHWGAFIEPLVSVGLRAVAIDAPAHGDSPGEQTDVLRYAMALGQLANELGELCGVVGHSWGAAASILAARRGLGIPRLVSISGPASLDTFVEGWRLRKNISDEQMPVFREAVEQRVGAPLEQLDVLAAANSLTCPGLVIHDERDLDIPLADAQRLHAAWPQSRLVLTKRYGHRRILLAKDVVREVVEFLSPDEGDG